MLTGFCLGVLFGLALAYGFASLFHSFPDDDAAIAYHSAMLERLYQHQVRLGTYDTRPEIQVLGTNPKQQTT